MEKGGLLTPTQLFPAAFCVVQAKVTRDLRPFQVWLLGLCKLCFPAQLARFGLAPA